MPPPKGHFVLHTNVMPAMPAGAYTLVTSHTGMPFSVAPETTHMTLAAPRYQMPVEQILSTFPPANAEGAFSDRLPQIVLKRRTLPWERNPAGGTATSTTPWLALVVVAEGEAELSTPAPVAQCVTPGVTLPEGSDRDVEQGLYLAVTETVKNKIFPCQQDLPLLSHVREVDVSDTELAGGDDDGWLAVVLANRLPVFDTVNAKPVRYLACLVNLEGQLGILPPPAPPEDRFSFELAQDWTVLAQAKPSPDPLVMGNFNLGGVVLPRAGTGPLGADRPSFTAARSQTVQGVTRLDGGSSMPAASVTSLWSTATAAVATAAVDLDAAYLVRDTMGRGFRYPISVVALEPVFRFPVLAHWSFTTSGDDTFETLMTRLDVGLLGTVVEPKPEDAPATAEPPEVVQTGHIGLGHRTRRGDRLRAWYRAPLVPFPTERDVPVDGKFPVAHASDQLRRIVPGGREDLSLAAAFEIGRLLGLSQLSVVSALTRFRAAQFGAGRARTTVEGIVDMQLPVLAERPDMFDLGRFVAVAVLEDISRNHSDILGPRRPLVDPGREINVDGDLEEIIAGGLGLNPDVIRRRAGAVGIVAALAQTAVPLAYEPGGLELDDNALAGLRNSLAAEVDHVVSVARPLKQRPGTVRDAQLSAPPAPDALDELLARLVEDEPEREDE
ncbi:hypothetical protein SRABI26_00390 [Arthrobacter sp. Bi26]|uniref:hypothetical protein n=1 Tax=Arthrobacter sp. Bi26 TaxID=2822350 RepID=UPI001D9C4596|nr:hypothetical protein [Arthrobacter sp. Bi26]CAH0137509.1 hypothetical protein SRABI26_00390 [Arthrobacter sp. Bi26]